MIKIDDNFIYDWNNDTSPFHSGALLHDETLRDGLQSTSVTFPDYHQSMDLVILMDKLGISSANVGFPSSSKIIKEFIVNLLRGMNQLQLQINACCAGRTIERDVLEIVDTSQKGGRTIEATLFIGSSPIRQYVEQWTLDCLKKK